MRFGKHWVLFERYVVGEGDSVYLRRLRIIETPWFRVYFHRILRSDHDRHLHDHPWNFTSLILRGGYTEYVPCDRWPYLNGLPFWRRPWSVVRHKATDLHRLELPDGESAWTLVFAGRRIREWGFQVGDVWVDWQTYLTRKTDS